MIYINLASMKPHYYSVIQTDCQTLSHGLVSQWIFHVLTQFSFYFMPNIMPKHALITNQTDPDLPTSIGEYFLEQCGIVEYSRGYASQIVLIDLCLIYS